MTLPRSVPEITGDWLTDALEIRYPDVKVRSLEIADVVASTTTKVRLRASYNAAGAGYGLPAEMILIGGLAGLPHEADLHVLYRNEGVFLYGHKDQVTHKTKVLKQICAEVARDFSALELTTFHVPQYLGSGDADPGVYFDLGIRHVIGLTQGPDWSLDGLKDLLAWRKALTSR